MNGFPYDETDPMSVVIRAVASVQEKLGLEKMPLSSLGVAIVTEALLAEGVIFPGANG